MPFIGCFFLFWWWKQLNDVFERADAECKATVMIWQMGSSWKAVYEQKPGEADQGDCRGREWDTSKEEVDQVQHDELHETRAENKELRIKQGNKAHVKNTKTHLKQ